MDAMLFPQSFCKMHSSNTACKIVNRKYLQMFNLDKMGDKVCDECRLPDEILAKIFSFCSFGTIFNVMLTSRRFRDCANINSVW